MRPEDTDGPRPPLEATNNGNGNGDRAPDPLRRVVAGFRDRRALLRARREAESLGCEESDIAVFAPPRTPSARFDVMRRLRAHLLGGDRSERGGVFDECLALLGREFMLVFVDTGSVTDRSCLEETFAEHGGVIVGADGRVFPDPDAVEDEARDPRLRTANGEDG